MSDRGGQNSVTELEKRMKVLSDEDIREVFNYKCYNRCRARNCCDTFAAGKTVNEQFKIVKDFRKTLWKDPKDLNFDESHKLMRLSGRDQRNIALIVELFEMKSPTSKCIDFRLGYDRVSIIIDISSTPSTAITNIYRSQSVWIFTGSALDSARKPLTNCTSSWLITGWLVAQRALTTSILPRKA